MAGGYRLPACLRRDPTFRGAAMTTRFIYGQIARCGLIVPDPGMDLVGTLVMRLDGLSDRPRDEVEAFLADALVRGLVRPDGDGIRTSHEPPPRPEAVELPADWDDTTRESWERRLRRARERAKRHGTRVDVPALLASYITGREGRPARAAVTSAASSPAAAATATSSSASSTAAARPAATEERPEGMSARVSAGASGHASGADTDPRPVRTPAPVRSASGADMPGAAPSSLLSFFSSQAEVVEISGEKREERGEETSTVTAREGGQVPDRRADTPPDAPGGHPADTPGDRREAADPLVASLGDRELAARVVEMFKRDSGRRLGWDFTDAQRGALVGALRRRELELADVRVLCAAAREEGGIATLFPWERAQDVRDKGRAPEAFLTARGCEPLLAAIDNAHVWDRRRRGVVERAPPGAPAGGAPAAATPPPDAARTPAAAFLEAAGVGVAKPQPHERSDLVDALDVALSRRDVTPAEAVAMGRLAKSGLWPQASIRALVGALPAGPNGERTPPVLDEWLARTRRTMAEARGRAGPGVASAQMPLPTTTRARSG